MNVFTLGILALFLTFTSPEQIKDYTSTEANVVAYKNFLHKF